MNQTSQNKAILSYLQQGHVLTPYEALIKFNCLRLSARIFDLRAMGYDIKTQIVKGVLQNNYAQYSIECNKKKKSSTSAKSAR